MIGPLRKQWTGGLRLGYAVAAVCTIAAGIMWRKAGLPPLAAKYSGAVLWGAMVFFLVAALRPASRLAAIAGLAAVVAAAVEFSQLVHIGMLDEVRRTTLGRLVPGVTFSWWDIVAYWIGIAAACAVVMSLGRARKVPNRARPR